MLRNWLRPGGKKISPLLWKESNLIIKTNRTKMLCLSFSAYQICVARNWTQLLTFPYVFPSFSKNQLMLCWLECSHWFLRRMFVSQEKLDNFHILALSVLKVCAVRRFSRYIVFERRLFIHTRHAKMQPLTISAYQASDPRNTTQYWTTE